MSQAAILYREHPELRDGFAEDFLSGAGSVPDELTAAVWLSSVTGCPLAVAVEEVESLIRRLTGLPVEQPAEA